MLIDQLNKEIITNCRNEKEDWLNMQCEEIEELEKHYDSKELHAKVRQLWENKTMDAFYQHQTRFSL